MIDAALLIVRQCPAPHAEMENLVAELQAKFHLDPYTTRQRLLGAGLVQLIKGERSGLEPVAALLRRYGCECWIVSQGRPAFAPLRLRSLSIGAGHVEFLCEGDKVLRLERGLAAVGVLADISGELAGKQVRRILARNAYLGREQAVVITPDNLRADILKGQPVFDCYLLDATGAVSAAFRVLPGRFNPEGLGGRASLGAARNLEAIIELVSEYAGRFRLHTDFGLSQLPGCMPQSSEENTEVLLGNLEALTRYGWLVAGLAAQSAVQTAGEVSTGEEGVAAGLAGLAVATGLDPASEELATLAGAVGEAVAEQPRGEKAPPPTPLPAPPDRPEQKASLRRVLPFIVATAGGGCWPSPGKATCSARFLSRRFAPAHCPARRPWLWRGGGSSACG